MTHPARRSVLAIVHPRHVRHGAGLATTDLTDADFHGHMNPFVTVSLYDMAGPTFPPHPHAGFSVATYILPESPIGFINQDTLGNRNRIAPGALHVTVAGRGVQHEEQPEQANSLARGFQIWIDHAEADREIDPYAAHLRASDVPTYRRDGATVRVVLGASNGVASPLAPPTPVRVIDIALEAGARVVQDLHPGENAFLLVIDGAVEIGGQRVDAGQAAATSVDGDEVAILASDGPARLMLFAGQPLRGPRVQHGPFIGRDLRQVQHFVSRFQAGDFGTLVPFAEQPGWRPNDEQEDVK